MQTQRHAELRSCVETYHVVLALVPQLQTQRPLNTANSMSGIQMYHRYHGHGYRPSDYALLAIHHMIQH